MYYSDKGIWENAPYPGIPDLLAALQAAGAALMVATSKPEGDGGAGPGALRAHALPYLRGRGSLDEAADQKAAAVRRCLEQGRGDSGDGGGPVL